MCRVLKQALPTELADKVPDPELTAEVATFKVDNSHAKELLGLKFGNFEDAIGDAARSIAKLLKA